MSEEEVQVTHYLNYAQWQKIYGEQFEDWKKSRYEGCHQDTITYIRWITEGPSEKKLFTFQQEALLKTIFHTEICPLKPKPILLNLATGTGKTLIMSSIIAYLQIRQQVDQFLLICPNTIVRDRLKRDFEGNAVFKEFQLFPSSKEDDLRRLQCIVMDGSSSNASNSTLHVSNFIVSNIHQLYTSHASGNNRVKFILDNNENLCILNDEAHNTKPKEYENVLKLLDPITHTRVDLTATPERADGKRPSSHEVMQYDVIDAYNDNIIKSTSVYRPDISKYEYIDMDNDESLDLTWHDKSNPNKKYTAHEVEAEKLLENPSIQLVTDPAPLRAQLTIAQKRYKEKRDLVGNKYRPILFVVTASIADAKETAKVMESEFKFNPFVVYGDKDDDKEEMRKVAANLGKDDSPYDSIVSVLMLREGWDVPEVSVIVLLRPFSSPLYARQIVGRGLRKVRRSNIDQNIRQELDIIDHQALRLMWLWDEMDATVYEGGKKKRGKGDPPSGPGPGTPTDFGDPDLIRPELLDLLQIPDLITFNFSQEEILSILRKILKDHLDFRCEHIMIVGQHQLGWTVKRQNGQEETFDENLVIRALPQDISNKEVIDMFKEGLVNMVNEVTYDFFELEDMKNAIYNLLLDHFIDKYFDKPKIDNVNPHVLANIIKILPVFSDELRRELKYELYNKSEL